MLPLLLPLPIPATRSAPTNGAEVVAARLEQLMSPGGSGAPAPRRANAVARLRDAVVFGYLMATPKHGRVDVPDWCVLVHVVGVLLAVAVSARLGVS
jgi:hypothetical protein